MSAEYDPLFEAAGKKHNVDPALLRTVAYQESRFNPKAVSPQGALGLMQIMPATARVLKVDPTKPEEAVDGAARLLAEALDRNNGNLEDAVGEYHGGPNREIWGPKNAKYRQEVLARYQGGDASGSPASAPLDADSVLFGDDVPKDTAEPTSEADAVLFGDELPQDVEFIAKNAPVPITQLNPKQRETYETFTKGGYLKDGDEIAPDGTIRNPFWQIDGRDPKDAPPGSYYVDAEGQLHRTEGGEEKSAIVKGAMRGVGDVLLSAGQLAPFTSDSQILNRAEADQMAYDADYKGDPMSGLGRFTGQVAGAVLPIGGVEAVVASQLPKLGAAGAFLAGKGGAAMAPGVARALTKGASMATKGAAEGAAAAALTSSANDEPLGEQLAQGALAGGVVGPLLPGAAAAGGKMIKAGRNYAERFTEAGRDKAINRVIGEVAPNGLKPDLTVYVPGSTPTLGEATGHPAIAALERNARTNPKVSERFSDRMMDNAVARKDFFEGIAKDGDAIADAETAREAATGKIRNAAFKKAKPADPTPVVDTIDKILAGPAGQRDVVVKALKSVRGKLTEKAGKADLYETDVEQLYGIRKSINDMLSPLASNEAKGSQLATRELMDVKKQLDKAIEKAAPGFRSYLKTYETMSRPIDEMKLLQGLNLTDARGNLTLGKVQKAIEKIEAQRKGTGVNKAKSVSNDTLDGLRALRDDLKRAGNIDLGKARGSDTAQNLVTGKMAEDLDVPISLGAFAASPILGTGLGLARRASEKQSGKVLDQLSTRLLDPNAPVTPVKARGVKKLPAVDRVLLPGAAGIAANNIAG